MEKILGVLAQHGPFAIIAGGLVYLFALVWKRYNEIFQQQHDALVADTKAKGRLTEALEDVVVSVGVLGQITGTLTERVDGYLAEGKIKQAKEEGRREATNPRFKIPRGEDDES